MSRTYRIRHLPGLTAKKYVDGHGGWDGKRRDLRLRQLRERYCPEYGGKYYWGDPFYKVKYDIEQQLERDFPAPAAPVHNHPWVSWGMAGNSQKVVYKRHGNRFGRRRSREIIRSMSLDEDYDQEHAFPTRKDELWNAWNLW